MSVVKLLSATEVAADHIRDLIVSDELPQGAKINLDELAATLGTSRTPVRDALARLQTEGLVQIISRVGVYVREISLQEVLEVYSIKASLEPLMAKWATERSSEEERAAYADSAKKLRGLVKGADAAPYIELIVARRARMIELARSEVISSIFRLIDERVRLLRTRNLSHVERRLASVKEHLAIAEAVRRGDADRAAELTRAHVESARSAIIDVTKRAHDGMLPAAESDLPDGHEQR